MFSRLRAAAVLLISALVADAAVQPVPRTTGSFETLRQYVPASSTAVTSTTFRWQVITLSNVTAGAVTVTIADRQGTPLALMQAVSLPANSTTMLVCPDADGCLMTSGLTWSASAGSSIVGYIKGRQ